MTKQLKTFALSLATAAVFATCGASAAFGAVSYKYATDLAALNLLPGDTATVKLYLVETTTDASTSRLVSENGLWSAYVGVSYVAPPSPLASPSTIDSVAANVALFTDLAPPEEVTAGDHRSAYVREWIDVEDPAGPVGTVVAPGVRQVLLGSVVLRAGTSGGTTTFRVGDDPTVDDTATVDGYLSPIDANAAIAAATFTVTTPVPEPGTAAAVAVVAGCLVATRRARRRE